MKINPFIIGSGRSANALKKSLVLLGIQHPDWQINKPVKIERGSKIRSVSDIENPILLIANPHGLHADAILEGTEAGFRAIIAEKPACVNLNQIETLRTVQIPVAVCHIYRQMWGIQTIRQMVESDELGEIICIEGRYWQSSTAQRAIQPQFRANSWKNDPKLSGAFDAFIDVGVHWVDAASFLVGTQLSGGSAWLSYANAEQPHRDSHAHLNLEFQKGIRVMASISKTFHGATNHFEINVIGTKRSANWTFLNPDEIVVGHGISRAVLTRKETQLGSQQPPFHGLGWLEGYVEIIRQVILELEGNENGNYPMLQDNLELLNSMLSLRMSSVEK